MKYFSIIIFSTLLSLILSIVFVSIQKSNHKKSSKMTDNNFTVQLPSFVALLGGLLCLIALIMGIGFTFFSNESPHFIFYLCLGFFFLPGIYLILKTVCFKVIVNDKNVKVFSIIKKPYSFNFDEVITAVRQTKKNQVKSERIVVKTIHGQKLIVESAEVAYKRFVKKIKTEVKNECLHGFDKSV